MLKEKTVICFLCPYGWLLLGIAIGFMLLQGFFLFYFCDLPRGFGGGADGRQTDLRIVIVGRLVCRRSFLVVTSPIQNPNGQRLIDRSIH